jgi:hypothetical protein
LDKFEFPRDLKGNFSTEDLYIDCQKGVKIFYYGSGILVAYFPSKQRGKNILKQIQEDLGNDVVYNIVESDSELEFKFKKNVADNIIPYLNPKTSGSNVSPFSTKNLPKSDYKISEDKLLAYNNLIENKGEISTLEIAHMSKKFLESIATKKNTIKMINQDMKQHCMKPKQYIDYIGKWDEYLEFLDKNL